MAQHKKNNRSLQNRYNLNQFEYTNNPSFNNVNISFVNSLRAKIEIGKMQKTIHQLPQCFGVTTASSMNKHNTKDLANVTDIGQFEHLIRGRIGIKPLQGSIIFETNLRNYDKQLIKESHSTNQYSRISRAMSQRQSTNPVEERKVRVKRKYQYKENNRSLDQGPYQEIQEKNMQLYQFCLQETKYGTIRPEQIKWLVSLKEGQKKSISPKK